MPAGIKEKLTELRKNTIFYDGLSQSVESLVNTHGEMLEGDLPSITSWNIGINIDSILLEWNRAAVKYSLEHQYVQQAKKVIDDFLSYLSSYQYVKENGFSDELKLYRNILGLNKEQLCLRLLLVEYHGDRSSSLDEYLTIWGCIFGHSRTNKLHAVEKTLDKLQGKKVHPLTFKERCAFFSGRLGKKVDSWEKETEQNIRGYLPLKGSVMI